MTEYDQPQTYSSSNEQSLAVQPKLTEVQLQKFVSSKPGLGRAVIPTLMRFSKLGFTESQLESILDIPLAESSIQGRPTKVKWFMDTILRVYSPSYLESLTTNYNRFLEFTTFASDVEDLRQEIAGERDAHGTYKLCFELSHKIGVERVKEIYETLIERSNDDDRKELSAIGALHVLKNLVRESEKTQVTPETLLAFRRGELGPDYFQDESASEK